jgi:hypothetical protein
VAHQPRSVAPEICRDGLGGRSGSTSSKRSMAGNVAVDALLMAPEFRHRTSLGRSADNVAYVSFSIGVIVITTVAHPAT